MPPAYAALRDRAAAAVDRVFAEAVRVSPMKEGRVDAGRPPFEVSGVLRAGAGRNASLTGGQSQGWRARISPQKAELHINGATNPNLDIRVGDRVRALQRDGEPRWEVLGVDDRGHARLVLSLGELGGATS